MDQVGTLNSLSQHLQPLLVWWALLHTLQLNYVKDHVCSNKIEPGGNPRKTRLHKYLLCMIANKLKRLTYSNITVTNACLLENSKVWLCKIYNILCDRT